MALFAIGDTHLSLSTNKPMDVFGGGWTGYVDKLLHGFEEVGTEDTVVLCGDLSWGMSLEEARADFDFLNRLPGKKKLLLKGNHDYWWNTASKMNRFSKNMNLIPFSCFITTVASTGTLPCAGPAAGFMNWMKGIIRRRCSTGS